MADYPTYTPEYNPDDYATGLKEIQQLYDETTFNEKLDSIGNLLGDTENLGWLDPNLYSQGTSKIYDYMAKLGLPVLGLDNWTEQSWDQFAKAQGLTQLYENILGTSDFNEIKTWQENITKQIYDDTTKKYLIRALFPEATDTNAALAKLVEDYDTGLQEQGISIKDRLTDLIKYKNAEYKRTEAENKPEEALLFKYTEPAIDLGGFMVGIFGAGSLFNLPVNFDWKKFTGTLLGADTPPLGNDNFSDIGYQDDQSFFFGEGGQRVYYDPSTGQFSNGPFQEPTSPSVPDIGVFTDFTKPEDSSPLASFPGFGESVENVSSFEEFEASKVAEYSKIGASLGQVGPIIPEDFSDVQYKTTNKTMRDWVKKMPKMPDMTKYLYPSA